jgi:hypothetical protein
MENKAKKITKIRERRRVYPYDIYTGVTREKCTGRQLYTAVIHCTYACCGKTEEIYSKSFYDEESMLQHLDRTLEKFRKRVRLNFMDRQAEPLHDIYTVACQGYMLSREIWEHLWSDEFSYEEFQQHIRQLEEWMIIEMDAMNPDKYMIAPVYKYHEQISRKS